MTIQTYPNNDNSQLSPHFHASEFACPCGKAHTFQIADLLIIKLEQLYDTLNCNKIIITSGYRCPEHDKIVGGTGKGQHTMGMAVDVICYNCNKEIISSKLVSCAAQDIGFTGIANIDAQYDKTHLDVRTSDKWYGNEIYGTHTITDDFYHYYNLQGEDFMKEIAYGIDVSYAQGKIDWEKVKTSGKMEFAILRAGYGREYTQVDEQFARNYSECKRLGIPIGVYWYSYATTAAEAKREAQVCLDTIQGKQFEYPIAFDIEEKDSLQNADTLCKAFCDAIEAAGYYAAIYTFKSALEYHLSDSIKSRYDIFLSHIGVSKTDYSGTYGLWQYSWTGNISGIDGDVDLDCAYRDYPKIIQQAELNGFQQTNSTDEKTNSNDEKETPLEQILQHVKSIDEKLS